MNFTDETEKRYSIKWFCVIYQQFKRNYVRFFVDYSHEKKREKEAAIIVSIKNLRIKMTIEFLLADCAQLKSMKKYRRPCDMQRPTMDATTR